jgi:hypothetical protein
MSTIVDSIIVALDARGPIDTALDVIRIASETAATLGSDVDENVAAVKTALIKVLSGPDGELYTQDDILPESVMRDIVDVLNTTMVEQLVRFFTQGKKRCSCFF